MYRAWATCELSIWPVLVTKERALLPPKHSLVCFNERRMSNLDRISIGSFTPLAKVKVSNVFTALCVH